MNASHTRCPTISLTLRLRRPRIYGDIRKHLRFAGSKDSRCRFSHFATMVVTQSDDPVLVRSFRGHNDAVTSVAFHTNMRQLISGGLDGNVMVWNFKPKMRALRFAGHKVYILSTGDDRVAVEIGRCVFGRVLSDAFADRFGSQRPDHSSVAGNGVRHHNARSCPADPSVWHSDGKSTELKAHSGTVRCVRFSQDGHHLISCSDDKSVKVDGVFTFDGAVDRALLGVDGAWSAVSVDIEWPFELGSIVLLFARWTFGVFVRRR